MSSVGSILAYPVSKNILPTVLRTTSLAYLGSSSTELKSSKLFEELDLAIHDKYEISQAKEAYHRNHRITQVTAFAGLAFELSSAVSSACAFHQTSFALHSLGIISIPLLAASLCREYASYTKLQHVYETARSKEV